MVCFTIYFIITILIIVQMEDIQRVTGLGIVDDSHQGYEDDFNQGYNDDGYDQFYLEDELVFNPDSDGIKVPSMIKRHSYSKISTAAEISSDEPMDDYISTDNDNDIRGWLMPKSVNNLRLNSPSKPSHARRGRLESLRPSDEDDEELLPEASVRPVTKTNYHSSNNISADKPEKFHEAEIRRFRECLTTAHSMLNRQRARLKDGVLDKYAGNGPLLVKLFKYETMLKSVFDILQSSDCSIPSVRTYEPRLAMGIPSDIYRVVEQTDFKVENTAPSRLREAHNFMDFNRVFEAEILRRSPLSPKTHISGESIVASIKFDIACAATKLSRRDLEAMQMADPELYKAAITRATNVRQYGMRVSAYTNAMGLPAALLIWLWLAIPVITRFPLHRLQHVFIDGATRFLKGSNEFRAIQALINHLSTWFDGWMGGGISSKIATERLEAFLVACDEGGSLPQEPEGARLACNTRSEPACELQKLIEMFAEIPRAENATYSTVGTTGHEMSLNIADMESLGRQRQLTERAIEAVLTTTKFPEGVMFARASGYGSLYDQQEYERERSMAIDKGVNKIICPIHTGESSQHWIGVVVRLDYGRRRPGISMILLDSMAIDANSAIYDEQVIKKIVLTWLRHRLPDFKTFALNGGLPRPRVEQQVDLNSCGVHMLLNLRAAGLNGKYISKGDSCTNKKWIDDARESFIKRILRSAGKHLGGDIESTINELLDDPGRDSRELETNNASAGRGVSPRLGS